MQSIAALAHSVLHRPRSVGALRLFAALVLCSSLLDDPPLRFSEAQTLKLSPTLTLEKGDDKVKTLETVVALVDYVKEKKLESNVLRFLENTLSQLHKVMDAAKTVEENKKLAAVPTEFTPTKYRVKAMPKLETKKTTVKKMTAADFKKKLEQGEALNLKEPMIITNATGLFSEGGGWDEVRRHWSASRIAEEENLIPNFQVEYWPPEKARARIQGNYLVQEDPDLVAFSRFLIICFHGTPAKPKLPGQNTEHCEQTVDAQSMVRNSSELAAFNILPQIKNVLPLQGEFRRLIIERAGASLAAIVGKGVDRWKKKTSSTNHQFFVFGPSGSGDKLHAENGLPFFDVLIHGSRRWLLLKEDEMERVAAKAREALEFDKTSAYMFFEEKLPELREEFGLKKYFECNQKAGDLVFVPSGWYRVSLSLADSISYYETMLTEKSIFKTYTQNQVWMPMSRQFKLAYCYGPQDLDTMPGIVQELGQKQVDWLKNGLQQISTDDLIKGILDVLLTCGSVIWVSKEAPALDISKDSLCTPKVWGICRKALKDNLALKGEAVSLDWLPEKAEDLKASRDEL